MPGYCTVADVRTISLLTTEEIDNTSVDNLITHASFQINSDLGLEVIGEKFGNNPVNSIDGIRLNFQTRKFPIGDKNDSFTITIDDFVVWNRASSSSPYRIVTPNPLASITALEGIATFTVSPDITLEWKWDYMAVPLELTNQQVVKACAELTAYLVFLKLNLQQVVDYRVGEVSIEQDALHPRLENFKERYEITISRIRARARFEMMGRPIRWDAWTRMTNEIVERQQPSITLNKGENP